MGKNLARFALVVTVALWSVYARGAELEDQLTAKYGHRLTFATSKAREVVSNFDIDCEFSDRRYLPLKSLLLLRLSMMDSPNLWGVTSVDSRGDAVRITDTVLDGNGPTAPKQLIMEIDEWGKLRPIGITKSAIRNACSGHFGKIWRVPR